MLIPTTEQAFQISSKIWVTWCLLWLLMAAWSKPTKRSEFPWQRLEHVIPLIFGFLLIYKTDFGWRWLSGRIVPENSAVAVLGLLFVIGGLLFAVWARHRARRQLERHGDDQDWTQPDPSRAVPVDSPSYIFGIAAFARRHGAAAGRSARNARIRAGSRWRSIAKQDAKSDSCLKSSAKALPSTPNRPVCFCRDCRSLISCEVLA